MDLLRTTSVRIRIANIRYAVVCAGRAWLFTSNDCILPTAEARKKKTEVAFEHYAMNDYKGHCIDQAGKSGQLARPGFSASVAGAVADCPGFLFHDSGCPPFGRADWGSYMIARLGPVCICSPRHVSFPCPFNM